MIIQVLWHIIIYSTANMFQESEGTYIKVRPQALFGGEPGGEEAYSYTHTHTPCTRSRTTILQYTIHTESGSARLTVCDSQSGLTSSEIFVIC